MYNIDVMAISIGQISENFKNSKIFKGIVLEQEEMKNHTTMKVGGNAALFLIPEDDFSVIHAIAECKKNDIKYFVLGGGSNLIVKDSGFDGVIISTEKINQIEIKEFSDIEDFSFEACVQVKEACDVKFKCGSGLSMEAIVEFCQNKGIKTLDTFAGLPGSCGGAAYMNARCYSYDVYEFIDSVEYFDLNEIESKSLKNLESLKKVYNNNYGKEIDYKKSPFTQKDVFISAVVFKGKALFPKILTGNESKVPYEIVDFLKEQNEKYVQDRRDKGHFKAPSAGSVFKNNRDFCSPSGKLIDEAGLKGTKIGGAQIAPWHGNFIINNGNASAKDIQDLVDLSKFEVKKRTGFDLECEIIFI